MRILIRLVAILAAAVAASSAWELATFIYGGLFLGLLQSGWGGWLLAIGWVIGLIVGPIAAVQLWRVRESGRVAGLALFGSGVILYLLGWLAAGPANSDLSRVLVQSIMTALPGLVLLLPGMRAAFAAR